MVRFTSSTYLCELRVVSRLDNKSIAAVAVVAIILCTAFAYVSNDDDRAVDSGPTWNYSNIVGNLPDAVDDFYLNTNYDWISGHQDTSALNSSLYTMGLNANNYLVSLVMTDPGDPNVSVYSQFMKSYMDAEIRDSTDAEELMPYVSGLMEAETLSDLTDYITSGDCVLVPPFLNVEVFGIDTVDDEYYMTVTFTSLTLSPSMYQSDSFRQLMEPEEDHYATLLCLMGYTQDEADAMNDAATDMEVKIAAGVSLTTSVDLPDTYNPMSIEAVDALCTSFPIVEVLDAMGYSSSVVSIPDVGWLRTLDSLYTEENFEGLRAMLLRNSLDRACTFMGGEFLDEFLSYNGMDLQSTWYTYIFADVMLVNLLNTMYCDHVADPEAAALVESLFHDLKDAMAVRISGADWMTDKTKAYALQKLDAMGIEVGGPDSVDYSSLTLPSANGGNALEDYVAMKAYYTNERASLLGKTLESNYWPLQSYTVNAANIWSANKVYVTWAFLQDGYYYNSDSQAFAELSSRVSDYISSVTLSPDRTMDPSIVINEVIADMGGMALAIDLGSSIEGFDFDKMFTEYSNVWATVYSQSYDSSSMVIDAHPPDGARVNMPVQQFQKFMDTFGVTEGDGMYLAPEDRVSIW